MLRYSAKYELDPELVTAVILVESSALPSARSPKGAMGLMQVMPAMLEPLRLVGNFTTVESNIEAGCLILADNIRRMGEADGILAYFWGPNIRGDAYLELWRVYGEEPLAKGEKSQCGKMDEIVYNMARGYQAARLLAKSIQARLILLNPKYKMEKSDLAMKAT